MKSPGLGEVGLGQGIPGGRAPQIVALESASLISRGIKGQVDYLQGVNPANWESRVRDSQRLLSAYLNDYKNNIKGKSGNPQLESHVYDLIWMLFQKNSELVQKPPSFWEQTKARIDRWFTDFKKGAADAWEKYMKWAMEAAGPTLKNYHRSVIRLKALEKDLEVAVKRGFPASRTQAQRAKLDAARERLNGMQSLFAKMGGGDLDKLAQENFGDYPQLGIAITITATAAAIIAIAALLIIGGLVFAAIYAIKPMTDALAGFFASLGEVALPVVGIIAAAVAAIYVLPEIFGKKPSPA